MRILYCLFLLLCATTSFAAAPGQPGAPTGSIVDGQNITFSVSNPGNSPLSGGGFFFDDFELGTVGQPILYGDNSAKVGQWVNLNPTLADSTRYSSVAFSGSKSFQGDFTTSTAYGYNRKVEFPMSRHLFVSRQAYLASNNNWPGQNKNGSVTSNFKTVWVHGLLNGGDNFPNTDYCLPTVFGDWSQYVTGNSHAAWLRLPSETNSNFYINGWMVKGRWQRIDAWIKGSTNGTTADGDVVMRLIDSTGAKNASKLNVRNMATAAEGGGVKGVVVPGYGVRDTPTPSFPLVDDFYTAWGPNARARVEICNSSDYFAATNCTIQSPIIWGLNSITVQVNRGSFGGGQSAYLIAINSLGEASPGRQITFGASAADEEPPAIETTNPLDGAVGVVPNTPFRVFANENLNCTTKSAVTINPGVDDSTCAGNEIVLNTSGQAYSTLYTVTVSTALEDVAGNNLVTQRTFSYTTAAATDTCDTLDDLCLTEATCLAAWPTGHYWCPDNLVSCGTVVCDEECSQENWHLCNTLEEVNAANAAGTTDKTIYYWRGYSRTIPEPSFGPNIVTQTNLAAPYTGTPAGWLTYSTVTAAEHGTYLANGQEIHWPMGILDNATMVWAINILPDNVGQLIVTSSISGINLTEPGTHVGTITVGEIVDHGWYLGTNEGPNAVTINGPVLAQFITTKYSKTNSTGMQIGVRASGTSVRMVQ